MRKFDHTQPFGTVTPPDAGRHYQQGGCFYGPHHEFVGFDLSTKDGQMLQALADNKKPTPPASPASMPSADADEPVANANAEPKADDEDADKLPEPTGQAIVANEDGTIDPDSIPDESDDDLSADGEKSDGVQQLEAYVRGEEKMEWFAAKNLAEAELGEAPASKKHLAEMLGVKV